MCLFFCECRVLRRQVGAAVRSTARARPGVHAVAADHAPRLEAAKHHARPALQHQNRKCQAARNSSIWSANPAEKAEKMKQGNFLLSGLGYHLSCQD